MLTEHSKQPRGDCWHCLFWERVHIHFFNSGCSEVGVVDEEDKKCLIAKRSSCTHLQRRPELYLDSESRIAACVHATKMHVDLPFQCHRMHLHRPAALGTAVRQLQPGYWHVVFWEAQLQQRLIVFEIKLASAQCAEC
jgi:hypothetical protein